MANVTIKVRKNGPYEVRGEITLKDHAGNAIEQAHEGVAFFCRCGHSSHKPFCDGGHRDHHWSDTGAE